MTPTMPSWQPTFSSGLARRDVVRSEQHPHQDSLKLATDAVAYGKLGQAEALVANAHVAPCLPYRQARVRVWMPR